jgi:hypothetical protein
MNELPNGYVLAPCPFCGGEVQFRKALWPSDGCTDAVIHSFPLPATCGMGDFSTDTTDESVIAAWNRRAPSPSSAVDAPAGQPHPSADGIERVLSELIDKIAPGLDSGDIVADARTASIALDRPNSAAQMLDKAIACAESWTRADAIKLAAGEMTAQELRTAQAVARGIAAAIRHLAAAPAVAQPEQPNTEQPLKADLTAPVPSEGAKTAPPEPPYPPRMNIYSPPGTKVIFDARGGWQGDKDAAAKRLTLNAEYIVSRADVGHSRTRVWLAGQGDAYGDHFNSCLFASTELPAPDVASCEAATGAVPSNKKAVGSPPSSPLPAVSDEQILSLYALHRPLDDGTEAIAFARALLSAPLQTDVQFDRDENDGELLIDWSPRQGRMLTLSLRDDGRLSYAFIWDDERAHGKEQMPPLSAPLQVDQGMAKDAARLLTPDEADPILDEIVGNYPCDLAEQIQLKFCEVNGICISPTGAAPGVNTDGGKHDA